VRVIPQIGWFLGAAAARQTDKKTDTNCANKSHLRSALPSMQVAIAKGDKDAAETTLSAATSAVDKGFQKGVLHESTASRYKSRINPRQRRSG
jgi:small subunit ribosomal protein S20